jgi:class 3 adenylate cyclase/tetratricopeptide (TPR) repeat protein
MRCPDCGQESAESARFCNACASPLQPRSPERRKLATMLFCDMSGSTALGERVDAESVREMMFSYFHEMRGAIERHGGTVEKFIGDAVMAVFGVPIAHEDDALRAVRAASEMQERLARLNEELERRYGSTIALRIGVNTGEVVAGEAADRQALVTGDAVNVAARLEQTASPGEILIGDTTFRLVRDAVSAEPVEPLELKGKSEPLPAYRLVQVHAAAPARTRRLDTPLVGRHSELALLRDALSGAAHGRPALVTVVGEPGVGKSRLAAELLRSAGEFQVLSGRCLQYGEGITYWPLAEMVHQAAGIRDEHTRDEALGRIAALVTGEAAATLAQAIGLAEGHASTQEIASAFASLLASLARDRPVLALVDDIHWAEPSLLELLVRLPAQAGDARLLLLCLARPELVEGDTAWEATIRLQPLEEQTAGELVEQLLGATALPAGLAERIAGAAGGNPLFVEELVGMLVDDGLLERRNGSWAATAGLAEVAIPPTLRELLEARLDRMPKGERATLERAAVEGQLFHRGAVAQLSETAERPHVPVLLQALAAREYIRPAPASFTDEGAFRIRHVLIRDAAYEGLPKRLRSTLHELFADWLEEKAGERTGEYEEILGYHLEQAYRYREELRPATEEDRALALRAAERLERAGRRALDRRDSPAAVNLLSRAAELLPPDSPLRLELLHFVAEELSFMMELERATSILQEVRQRAAALGDRRLEAHARLWLGLMRFFAEPDFGALELLAELAEAETVFAELGDERGIARTHDGRSFAYSHLGRFADSNAEAEKALGIFLRIGDRRLAVEQYWYVGWAAERGPELVDDAIERCRRILDEAGDDPAVGGHTRYSLAVLEAKRGRFDDARELADQALAIFEETGMVFALWHPLCRGRIERLAGNDTAAERELRRSLDPLVANFDFPSATSAASLLAEILVDRERPDEAGEVVALAADWAPKDQPIAHARVRAARARLLARQGDPEAEAEAREAVRLADTTDFLELRADCRVALADVLRVACDHDGATEALTQALGLYELKGNVVSADKVRALRAPVDEFAPRSSSYE